MAAIVRLQNLPQAAKSVDIRHFFYGINIIKGGIHIIGGRDGIAFIVFSSEEDAQLGMLRDGSAILECPIKLLRSSGTEMCNYIGAAWSIAQRQIALCRSRVSFKDENIVPHRFGTLLQETNVSPLEMVSPKATISSLRTVSKHAAMNPRSKSNLAVVTDDEFLSLPSAEQNVYLKRLLDQLTSSVPSSTHQPESSALNFDYSGSNSSEHSKNLTLEFHRDAPHCNMNTLLRKDHPHRAYEELNMLETKGVSSSCYELPEHAESHIEGRVMMRNDEKTFSWCLPERKDQNR